MTEHFDFEKRERKAESAMEYLRAGGIPATERGMIFLFMMHPAAELIRKSPQMIRVPLTLAGAGRWIQANFGPCKNLRFNRSTAFKKFAVWKQRGVMDRPPTGPEFLYCNFTAAQEYADGLHECLETFSSGFTQPVENPMQRGECFQAFLGVSASIDGLSENNKRIQSLNPVLLQALKSLPPEIWDTENTSERRVFKLAGEWWNGQDPKPDDIEPALKRSALLGAILAARHGEPKADPVAYVAKCLPDNVKDNWITRARGLFKAMNSANKALGR